MDKKGWLLLQSRIDSLQEQVNELMAREVREGRAEREIGWWVVDWIDREVVFWWDGKGWCYGPGLYRGSTREVSDQGEIKAVKCRLIPDGPDDIVAESMRLSAFANVICAVPEHLTKEVTNATLQLIPEKDREAFLKSVKSHIFYNEEEEK